MRTIFFPLRSNCGWFTSAETQGALERKIKTSMVLYDQLGFQDGRYHLTILDTGASRWHVGPKGIPGDRHEVRYHRPGGEFAMRVASEPDGEFHPLVGGPVVEAFEVDFFPILSRAGLLGEGYIFLENVALADEAKSKLQPEVWADRRNNDLAEAIPGNKWLREDIIESVHHDSFLCAALGCGMITDARMSGFIARKNHEVAGVVWRDDPAPTVLDTIARLRIPDYGDAEWETVRKVRESLAGRELREMLHRLTESVVAELPNLRSERDLTLLISSLFVSELMSEVRQLTPDLGNTAFDVGLNLVSFPIAGAVSVVRDLAAYIAAKQSWVSLMR